MIPTAREFHIAGLGEYLWWNDFDYRSFKLSAVCEIKEFMKLHPELDNKKAIKLCYECSTYNIEETTEPLPDSIKSDSIDLVPIEEQVVISREELRSFSNDSQESAVCISPRSVFDIDEMLEGINIAKDSDILPISSELPVLARSDSVDLTKHDPFHHHTLHGDDLNLSLKSEFPMESSLSPSGGNSPSSHDMKIEVNMSNSLEVFTIMAKVAIVAFVAFFHHD